MGIAARIKLYYDGKYVATYDCMAGLGDFYSHICFASLGYCCMGRQMTIVNSHPRVHNALCNRESTIYAPIAEMAFTGEEKAK